MVSKRCREKLLPSVFYLLCWQLCRRCNRLSVCIHLSFHDVVRGGGHHVKEKLSHPEKETCVTHRPTHTGFFPDILACKPNSTRDTMRGAVSF